jgi:DNA-binding LacI/PurR family transcriptional regulator
MILGYANNMDIRPTEPTLTYIKVPYFEMGRTGTEILIRSIVNCTPTPEREYVSAELIIGNTTRKKNKIINGEEK